MGKRSILNRPTPIITGLFIYLNGIVKGMESVMTEQELNDRIKEYRSKGMVKREYFRECSKPDIDGLRKIISENPKICIFSVNPNPARNLLETLNFEEFESVNDEEFSKEARKMLCEGLGIKQPHHPQQLKKQEGQ